jgi:hypothetical protein
LEDLSAKGGTTGQTFNGGIEWRELVQQGRADLLAVEGSLALAEGLNGHPHLLELGLSGQRCAELGAAVEKTFELVGLIFQILVGEEVLIDGFEVRSDDL